MDIRSLKVRFDDLVLPAWNKLLDVLASFRISAGRGILLTRTSGGVIINVRQLVDGFEGSWAPQVSGESLRIKDGFVNGLEPLIDGRPISGRDDPKGQPILKLKDTLFDELGASWLAIRLKVDAQTGQIIAPTKESPNRPLELTIVQSDSLLEEGDDDTVWLHPLAVFRRPAKAKTGFGQLHRILYFDQKHQTGRQNEKWRHYLNPAA